MGVGGLVSDSVHDGDEVFGAVSALSCKQMLPFRALLVFGDILHGANDTRDSPLASGALAIGEPRHSHPANLAVSPPNPILLRGALRTCGIKHFRVVRPKPLSVVRMQPLPERIDRYLITCDIKNLFIPRIPRSYETARIIPPPPKPRCIEGKLQTLLALLQVHALRQRGAAQYLW
jgi:hypothetical protein